ncbi:MAG: hypothetical protein EOO24_43175, partial [Comamonadaceae bacterium]
MMRPTPSVTISRVRSVPRRMVTLATAASAVPATMPTARPTSGSGIVSLGHAAFFGFGGYAAALFAKHLMPDPLVGLAVGIVAGTALAAVASVTILRGTDLTRLMVTLGVGL